jgi:hypothetical protein
VGHFHHGRLRRRRRAQGQTPNVDIPPPFALSDASSSLHARHEEQRFLFLLKSFEWLHWWHCHDEARRVADCSVGILLREGEKEIGLRWIRHGNLEEKILLFLSVESILIYIRDLQYRSEIPPPNIEWRESQGDTQLSMIQLLVLFLSKRKPS